MSPPEDRPGGAERTRRAGALGVALASVLAALLLLYLSGARHADPGIAADPDLEILRAWLAGGDPGKLPDIPGHLTKPGYLLLLRVVLPQGGRSTEELRRLLVVNALFTWTGIVVLSLVLWIRGRPGAALSLATLSLLFVAFRDVNDWIASEPLGVGCSFLYGAALVALVALPARSWIGAIGLGVVAALVLLVRPNLGYAFLLLAIAIFATDAVAGWWRPVAALLLGFVLGLGLLSLTAKITGLPVDARTMNASKALFFGTEPYAWPPGDASGWPSGTTPEEIRRGELEAARTRWLDFARRFGPDELRSVLWSSTHPILSLEQFPPRWRQPAYMAASKFLRRWWWIAGILVAAAAAACAVAARGRWRFVPALLLTVMAGQGLLFGAETRYALPLWPVFFLGLVLAASTIRMTRVATAAAATTALVLGATVWRVPDAVASNYAVTGEAGDVISQYVPRSRFRGPNGRTVHLRMLAAPRTVGLEIRGNGELLLRRSAGDRSPYPAFQTLWLAGAPLARARREGLRLEVRSMGDEAGKGFLYFPVVPDLFGSLAELDGSRRLPSGFGGVTTGAFPVWTHPGKD